MAFFTPTRTLVRIVQFSGLLSIGCVFSDMLNKEGC